MSNEGRGQVTGRASRIALWWLVVVAVAAWLLWMTLRPQEQAVADLKPITVPAAAQGISIPFLIDFLGNIVVFVPLGAAVALANRPRRMQLLSATAVGAGLSAVIELLQRTLPSRYPDLDDWALNTVGTFIGALIASLLINRHKRSISR